MIAAATAALVGLAALVWSLAGGGGGEAGSSPTTVSSAPSTSRATTTTAVETTTTDAAGTGPTAPTATAAATRAVPDLSAQFTTPAAVEAALRAAGFAVTRVPTASPDVASGTVIRLDPAAGTPLAPGAAVKVLVSTGASDAKVPTVDGQPADAAQQAVEAAGFSVRRELVENPFLEAGLVIETQPAGGTVELKGVTVVLRVSSGPATTTTTPAPTTTRTTVPGGTAPTSPTTPTTPTTPTPTGPRVPNVVGLSPQAASARLSADGYGASRGADQCAPAAQDGLVVSQNPGSGASVEAGGVVFFFVGNSLQC